MRANCLLMLLRVSSAVALLPVASRVGVNSLPAIARRGKGTVSLEDFEHCELIISIGHNPAPTIRA